MTSCNDDDGLVAISATLNFSDKTYTEFSGGQATFTTADGLVSSFEGGNLVLTKTLGSDDCDTETVDSVEVKIFLELVPIITFVSTIQALVIVVIH